MFLTIQSYLVAIIVAIFSEGKVMIHLNHENHALQWIFPEIVMDLAIEFVQH